MSLQTLVAFKDEALADLQAINGLGKLATSAVASSGDCGDFDVVEDLESHFDFSCGCTSVRVLSGSDWLMS